MTELGTALRELADRQQPVGGKDAADLWKQGRRRAAGRRAVSGAAVVALAVLVAGIGVAGPEPRLISPASEPHGPGIPNRVEDPPGWLKPTAYGKRVGPLSVLARGMRHGRMELFGIDAKSGKYRFLPNGDIQVPGTPVALSPNGRYVAYWAGSDGKTVTSLTVFDTVTGTESGLSSGDENKYGYIAGALTWLNNKTVLLAFDEKTSPDDQTLGLTHKVETFGVDGTGPDEASVSPQLVAWSRARDGSLLIPYAASAGRLASPPEIWQSLGSDLRQNGDFLSLPQGDYRQVSRSGNLSVAIGSTGAGGHTALLARHTLNGDPNLFERDLRDVGDLYVGTFLGWRSADSVLVTGWQHAPNGQASLFEANVRTGKVKRVGDAGDDADVVLAVASDLLEKPLVEANPPTGLNPRIVHGLELALLLLLLACYRYWRRRARR